MKNYFLIVAVFSIAMCLVSCEDNTDDQIIRNINDTGISVLKEDPGYIGPMRKYEGEDPNLGDAWCSMQELDCFPIDIIVTPKEENTFVHIFDLIAYGNSKLIISAFISDYNTLKTYIDTKYLDNVIDGKMLVTYEYNLTTGVKYMIFTDLNGHVAFVYPFDI